MFLKILNVILFFVIFSFYSDSIASVLNCEDLRLNHIDTKNCYDKKLSLQEKQIEKEFNFTLKSFSGCSFPYCDIIKESLIKTNKRRQEYTSNICILDNADLIASGANGTESLTNCIIDYNKEYLEKLEKINAFNENTN